MSFANVFRGCKCALKSSTWKLRRVPLTVQIYPQGSLSGTSVLRSFAAPFTSTSMKQLYIPTLIPVLKCLVSNPCLSSPHSRSKRQMTFFLVSRSTISSQGRESIKRRLFLLVNAQRTRISCFLLYIWQLPLHAHMVTQTGGRGLLTAVQNRQKIC